MKQNLNYRLCLINSLIQKYEYTSYLEIGVATGGTFNNIEVSYKFSVDPVYSADFAGTSDAFFAECKEKFDIIFIDGFHEEEQVTRDIENSLKIIKSGGTILVHDCNPETEWHQRPWSQVVGNEPWCGTGWKSIANLRRIRLDLDISVINEDCGIGIIQYKKQDLEGVTYKELDKDRISMLGLIDSYDFMT